MIYVFFLISILMLIFSLYIYKSKINPISLYCFVWMIVVALYKSNLVYTYELYPKTIIILIITSIVFFIGSVIGIIISKYTFNPINLNEEFLEMQRRKLVQVIMFISLILSLKIIPDFIVNFLRSGFTFSHINDLYKEQLYDSYESRLSIDSLIYVVVVFSGYYLSRYGIKNYKVYFPIILAIIDQLNSGARGGFVMIVMLFFAPFTCRITKNFKINKKNIYLIIIMIMVFLFSTYIRNTDNYILEYSSVFLKNLPFSNVLYSIILYIIGGLGCLNIYLQNPILNDGGSIFFRVPLILLNKIGITSYDLTFRSYTYQVPFTSNVLTYIGELFHDFGIYFFIPIFIMAILFSLYFNKSQENGSLVNVNLYSIFFVIFMLSWFVYIGRLAVLWYVLVFGTILSMYIEKSVRGKCK